METHGHYRKWLLVLILPVLLASVSGLGTAFAAEERPLAGSGVIVLTPRSVYTNKLINIERAMDHMEGRVIQPGEEVSFNAISGLLYGDVPFEVGYTVKMDLVRGGGICTLATLMATAVKDSGMPFLNLRYEEISRPVPHSKYYSIYHQVNVIDGRKVPVVDSTVLTYTDRNGNERSAADLRFRNTTGHALQLHFSRDWTESDRNPAKPFAFNSKTFHIRADFVIAG